MKTVRFFLAAWMALSFASCGQKKEESIEKPEELQESVELSQRLPHLEVMVPMRDGAELPMDIYLPTKGDVPLPFVLVRAPNGRKGNLPEFNEILNWGYGLAIQDTRVVVDDEGRAFPYMSDGFGVLQDGYDTVEWLAEQEYCNGKVGTVGNSALGITQLLMAPTAPPHLHCQYIGNAAPSLYHYAVYQGGQLRRTQVEGWLGQYIKNDKCLALIRQLPDYNPFWGQVDALPRSSTVNVPAVHRGGWYDTFLQGTIDGFVKRQEEGAEGAKGKQKLIIGPWTHFSYASGEESLELGEFQLPEQGRQNQLALGKKDWLDYYLKGESNGVDNLAPVNYYVMGPLDGTASKGNVWRQAEQWPVAAETQLWYFSAQGGLSLAEPVEDESSAVYVYDPEDPTPTCGGRNLFLPSGPRDQRMVEARNDVLVFTTEVLDEDLEVTGRVLGKLFFETDQKDTDVALRLCDVYPDGKSVLIADGITRLSSVSSSGAENCVEVDVDLWSTSQVFAKGHRIRVSVSSANYPRYERNLNLGRPDDLSEDKGSLTACNRVHMAKTKASRLVLPVVRS